MLVLITFTVLGKLSNSAAIATIIGDAARLIMLFGSLHVCSFLITFCS